jgi:hypothetical protein
MHSIFADPKVDPKTGFLLPGSPLHRPGADDFLLSFRFSGEAAAAGRLLGYWRGGVVERKTVRWELLSAKRLDRIDASRPHSRIDAAHQTDGDGK